MKTYGSLFTGIGGADLALDRLGLRCQWQCESSDWAFRILCKNWPKVRLFKTIQGLLCAKEIQSPDLIIGGDPCQAHSIAKRDCDSKSPDLAGYFLAVVARLRPQWVVRENVLSSTTSHFYASLVTLGYGAVSLLVDSRSFTHQSRPRNYIVASLGCTRPTLKKAFLDASNGKAVRAVKHSEASDHFACLAAWSYRIDLSENLVFEEGQGFRFLSTTEYERLQGFPEGWTSGLSFHRRRVLLGNAMTVPVIEWLGRVIIGLDRE